MTGTSKLIVRRASLSDVSACVQLVEERRQVYETFEPRFWKKADGSEQSTIEWFGELFLDGGSLCIVAEFENTVRGFLIARDIPVPPVYDPGGPTALIDDFCVADNNWKEIGTAILDHAREELRNRGCVQIVVVGAQKDDEKTTFLRRCGLSLASTWWTSEL